MDQHAELIKSVDEKVVERLKHIVEDCIKTISRNVHCLLKLVRKVNEMYSPYPEQRLLEDIFGHSRLERWLSHFDTLSLKVKNSFSEIIYHLQELLDVDGREKLSQCWGRADHRSLVEILEEEVPQLREEVLFLFTFLDPIPMRHGIIEAHKRADGGTHITSHSTALKNPSRTMSNQGNQTAHSTAPVSNPTAPAVATPTTSQAPVPFSPLPSNLNPKQAPALLPILTVESIEEIDLSKYSSGDKTQQYSCGSPRLTSSPGHLLGQQTDQ